ncbi:alkyl sulfatase dimerization domain-containing protein [Hyphomicrobium sp. MC1]|uniref:alkyl sulfatase dimerization domain-containing protein n=1 Tax=Hyphomicrobium sp. (strain MC1) TaxID=717785 RepID=UPI000213D59D|nr:alkyl sulfatase dimerization domain-containing protein [Hyphomicrobium sp. MC1]CCB65003.1 protein of unknown function [Hyphomicrobium sp. MC1]
MVLSRLSRFTTTQHNSRSVIQRYLGFWDCNPTTLIPLSPGEFAPLYVEMIGECEKILAVLLKRGDKFEIWLSGTPSEAFALVCSFDPANMRIVQSGKKDLLTARHQSFWEFADHIR